LIFFVFSFALQKKMFLLTTLFLLVVYGNKITNNGVMRIDQEYSHNAPTSSWITIELAHPGAAIKSIIWCKSITPNPKHAGDRIPAPINDCKGSGLTHLQLYPSARERVRMPADEPNFVYIDPEEIGGWDTEHQFSIIVNADIDKERNARLMQVVRFNVVPSPPPLGGGEGTPINGAAIPPTIQASLPPQQQQGTVGVDAIFVPPFVKETSKPAIVAQANDVFHPWLSTLIVFTIGFCVLLALGSVTYYRQTKRFAKKRSGGGLNAYQFEKLPNLVNDENADGIELQPISSSNADSVKILMSLGKGANKAFEMNLK
jgi:hypothetical protein